jgi:hypothetical protein
VAVVALLAVALGACDASDDEVAFEVVADTTQPAIARAGPQGANADPPLMPGAEAVVAAIVHKPRNVEAVWDQIGFDESVASLDEGEDLMVIAGGQPASCPWTVKAVEAGPERLSVRLTTGSEASACRRSGWQPRALALTVPAAATPSPGDGGADARVWLGTDSSLPASVLPAEVWRLNPDGRPPWSGADTAFPYQKTQARSSEAELTADRPVAVTTFPGFDVVHVRFAARDGGRLLASYVADPPVPVTGDAFLQLEVGPPGASPSAMPRRIHAPAQAAITEIARLPNRRAWIVGLEGGKSPLSVFSGSYDLSQTAGSAYLIGLPHPN